MSETNPLLKSPYTTVYRENHRESKWYTICGCLKWNLCGFCKCMKHLCITFSICAVAIVIHIICLEIVRVVSDYLGW